MLASKPSEAVSLLTLPRELRDHILGYLVSGVVFTSPERKKGRPKRYPKAYFDARIYLPHYIPPSVRGVCRQLREECLQLQDYALRSLSRPLPPTTVVDPKETPSSNILVERMGKDDDEEAERFGDVHIRITLDLRYDPGICGFRGGRARDEVSPCFLNLLPPMEKAKALRLVIWPDYNWWYGLRPRWTHNEDDVSIAIAKVLKHLPAIEELDIDILVHVRDLSIWNLPGAKWKNVQYWLDGQVVREGGQALKKVNRALAGVWNPKLIEPFYEQQEIRSSQRRVSGCAIWHVKRHGDMRTPTVLSLADPGKLGDVHETVDEEYDRPY
ncbi:hypothetical protein GQ44DRAFT_757497 [Phaeosphaeriaceae sp. PMI808]|nr:hypothetical protein GQ44DRAFT_757497 [Phaeosphaeriaceae sp. PMI808]